MGTCTRNISENLVVLGSWVTHTGSMSSESLIMVQIGESKKTSLIGMVLDFPGATMIFVQVAA